MNGNCIFQAMLPNFAAYCSQRRSPREALDAEVINYYTHSRGIFSSRAEERRPIQKTVAANQKDWCEANTSVVALFVTLLRQFQVLSASIQRCIARFSSSSLAYVGEAISLSDAMQRHFGMTDQVDFV